MSITIRKIQDSVTPAIANLIRAINSRGRAQLLLAGGQELYRQTLSNFGSSGRYKDKAWPPLSKAYAKKVGRSNATDFKTGALKASIQLSRPKGNYIELFTRNKYAATVAFGDKKRKIPARNFFPVQSIGNPSYNRLVYNSERDLFRTLTTRLSILSSGAFPRQSTITERMTPTYGSPFTGPQAK